MISKRVLTVFVLLMGFTVAELAWWITFQMRSSKEHVQQTLQHYEDQRVCAEQLLASKAESQGVMGLSFARQYVKKQFPYADLVRGESVVLKPYYPGYRTAVSEGVVKDMYAHHHARVRMFLWEGAFFLVLVMVGGLLIVRTLRKEVALSKQQGNFLSAVTHELKSPLASIRLYTETLLLRDVSSEKKKHYLEAVSKDVSRLETLVGNLLAVARLEENAWHVSLSRADLVQDVHDVMRVVADEVSSLGVMVHVSLPQEPLWVLYDPMSLSMVLRNLVDNAIKYGGASKQVWVRLSRVEDTAVLEVEDHGMGFVSSEASKMFEKFYRVGDEMVRQTPGSGLGLYLVQALAQGCNAYVSAHSEGLGKGAVFKVVFPLHANQGAHP